MASGRVFTRGGTFPRAALNDGEIGQQVADVERPPFSGSFIRICYCLAAVNLLSPLQPGSVADDEVS